jgi:hypothetical protein
MFQPEKEFVMTTRLRVGFSAIALLLAPMSALAQVANGSFETPTVPGGSFTSFNSGTSFSGWNVVGPTGSQVSIVSGTFSQFGLSFPAQSGSQWLDLTGNGSNAAEGVSQSITTLPGSTYDVSFFVGNVANPGGIFGTSSTVNVLANGTSIGSGVNSGGAGTTTLNWAPVTLHFTATSPTTTLTFLNGDPVSDNSNGLDNITVSLGTVGPVPEPGTLVLVASGLLAAGAVARRRRS